MGDRRHGEWDVGLAVAAGGALGGGLRWLVGLALPTAPGAFPWSTFVENVSGSFAIGVVLAILGARIERGRPPSRYARAFWAVGLLGGYTTFSTYSLQIFDLLRAGEPAVAIGYAGASVLAGLVGAWAGITVTERVLRPRAGST